MARRVVLLVLSLFLHHANGISNIEMALSYAEDLIGTHYGWWLGGEISKTAPAWAENAAPPSQDTTHSTSVFCAGIPNLMLRVIGGYIPCDRLVIPDPECGQCCGGTGAYGMNYSVAKYMKFDMDYPYPRGTLLGRPYFGVHDQGHVAVLLGIGKTGRLLQSYVQPGPDCPPGVEPCNKTTPGVDASYTLEEAFTALPWFCNFTYAILPDDWLVPKCRHGLEGDRSKRCYEACSDSSFDMKGIDTVGYCPEEYNYEESSMEVRQCPDGETNLKYCEGTAVTVTVTRRGVTA